MNRIRREHRSYKHYFSFIPPNKFIPHAICILLHDIALSVLYWKLTQSLSKSYPGVFLRTRFLLIAKLQL
jgi:hypothetical protein